MSIDFEFNCLVTTRNFKIEIIEKDNFVFKTLFESTTKI